MSPREYRGWREANEQAPFSVRAERPCEDCPLTWRLAALAEGRCNEGD